METNALPAAPLLTPTAFMVLGLVVGGIVAWLIRGRECAALHAEVAEERGRSAVADARLASQRESFDRERSAAEQAMLGQFQNLAQQALGNATASFLDLAATKLGAEREALSGSVSTRVEEIKGVISPIHDEFVKFTAAVSTLQANSAQDLGALKTSLEQVLMLQSSLQEAVRSTNDATGQLRNALQNPRVAGNWGEIGLDRIVELAGMTEHCDFERQKGVRAIDGSAERPDLIIYLTGGLTIPVDAKGSAANYIRATGESDEEERKRLLKQSAIDIKGRVTELRARAYDKIDGYAGMTFLFVPNEAMLSSALSLEPNLIEDALRDKIVICSPLLLLCYLRAFANGWRIQHQQDNAEEVARRGRMLHDRLVKFFESLGKVGRYLNHTVEKFNDCVAKTDNLLVPGRELGKLLAIPSDLEPVDAIATVARDSHLRVPVAAVAMDESS